MYEKNFTHLKVKKENHFLWVSFDRPESRNAITIEMINSLEEVLPYADADSEIRVIILSGEGKSFCAGGDIKNMLEKKEMFEGPPNELRMRYRNGIQKIPEMFHRLNTPIVAMIGGHAIGAGCDITSMCDLAVASENAKFGETFNKIGLIPGDGGTYFLQRKIGFAKATEMYLTAKIYSASEVHAMGLVNEVVSEEKLKEKTLEICNAIAANAPIATAMTKRALVHGYESSLSSQLDLLAAFQGITQRTEDHFSALKATENKKAPDFKNL